MRENIRICVVGLGYVGLPLAIAFAEKDFSVIGFDLNQEKIDKAKDPFVRKNLQNDMNNTKYLKYELLTNDTIAYFSSLKNAFSTSLPILPVEPVIEIIHMFFSNLIRLG